MTLDQMAICFAYDRTLHPHVLPIAQECSAFFGYMVDHCPQNTELLMGLRKLLEAKDCFLRSFLFQPE